MAPKFGTSGLRGLVEDLTPALVGAYVGAFVRACPTVAGLHVGRDLRPSSRRIADDVIAAGRALGLDVTDCGATPTPALALAAMSVGASAVMVTGSHIPADRNGLKFYGPSGEITKAQEQAILAALATPGTPSAEARVVGVAASGRVQGAAFGGVQGAAFGGGLAMADPGPQFVARYRRAFGSRALAGRRIGVWLHSAVGRDLLAEALTALGARVIAFARSKVFVPVDTEAVSPEARALLARAAAEHRLDAIASGDGDGDRPLLADATGRVIAGDILGQITAQFVGAQVVVTPVSSNTGVEALGFERVIRTRIGSPFVIAGMDAALACAPGARVVGYEANGGFLLGFDAHLSLGPLARLMTRDSLLPILAPLAAASAQGYAGLELAGLVARQPARFTASDRLPEVPPDASAALVDAIAVDAAGFLADLGAGTLTASGRIDGLRMVLKSGRIVHLRASGNAPELRVYAEAESPGAAAALLNGAMAQLSARLRGCR